MAEYFVSSSASGGGAGTVGDPYTLAEACDNVSEGDKVWVKADGDYTTQDGSNNCIFHVTEPGSARNEIIWEGYHTYYSEPNGPDGGIVTIDAGSTYANALLIAGIYNVFKNFRFTGATGDGVDSGTVNYLTFKNCLFDNNSGDGVDVYQYCIFECCQFENNGIFGANVNYYTNFLACVSCDNSSYGIYVYGGGTFINCLLYNNTTYGIYQLGGYYVFFGCTIDGENTLTAGIRVDDSNSANRITANNIIYDCTTGITHDGNFGEYVSVRNNLYYDNGQDVSGLLAVSTGNGVGNRGDVSGEPGFNDESNNDYTLSASGNANAKGLDAKFTVDLWKSFDQGTGDNPPSP